MLFNKGKKEEETKSPYNDGFKFIFSPQEGNALQKLLQREKTTYENAKTKTLDKMYDYTIGSKEVGAIVEELNVIRSKAVCIEEILNALRKWTFKNDEGELQFHMPKYTFRELCKIIHDIRGNEYTKIAQMPNDVIVQQALTTQLAEELELAAKNIRYLSDAEQLIERYKEEIYK
jgi:hypothetical protein